MIAELRGRMPISRSKLEAFCRKWGITRLELFGSVLREDFDPAKSDVDVLVTFAPGIRHGLDFFSSIPDELADIFGRNVDLLTRKAVEQSPNEFRKKAILARTETVYES
ncbi:MAG: nucleotidyltransferase domain-containing protein [Chthoniobacterales bacterium]|nr:nucleotidyltransferase domain-containing protein [Chthoniobacterales bacterium]